MPGLQVGDLVDVVVEAGGDELVAGIAAGLAQFFEDVVERVKRRR